MKIFLLLLVCAFVLFGCEDEEMNNKPVLHEKYNGQYELFYSVSKEAVDLNNDGIESTNLLDENSMILFSTIEIRVPQDFLDNNEFVFCELWPTENNLRLKNNEVITVYKTPVYGWNYDLCGIILLGKFADDLKTCTLENVTENDGVSTLVDLKSLEFMENETIKIIVIRKLYTSRGWVLSEVESLYKRYTIIT